MTTSRPVRAPRTERTACSPGDYAVRLCVTRPRTPGPVIREAADACRVLSHATAASRESMFVLLLDRRNRVLGVDEVARGGVFSVDVAVAECFKAALLVNAAAILVAHNHPSGDPAPSDHDLHLTRQLVAAGRLLGLDVLDHIIIAASGCQSLLATHPALFDS